jgi:hypothetical protein
LDQEVKNSILALFHSAWNRKTAVRLVGVHAGSLSRNEGQMSLLQEAGTAKLRNVFRAVDHIRDRFGSQSISLARTAGTDLRERVHENPFDLPTNRKE